MQKKSIKIETVTGSSFIDKNRCVILFFKAKNLGSKMIIKKRIKLDKKVSILQLENRIRRVIRNFKLQEPEIFRNLL